MVEQAFTIQIPPDGWHCFHCGEAFTTVETAREHFGFDRSSDPACIIKLGAERGLISHIRDLERKIFELESELHNESASGLRSYRAAEGRFRTAITNAEELGYERGVANMRKMGDDHG